MAYSYLISYNKRTLKLTVAGNQIHANTIRKTQGHSLIYLHNGREMDQVVGGIFIISNMILNVHI